MGISLFMIVLLAHLTYWHFKYQREHDFGPEKSVTSSNTNYDDMNRLSRVSSAHRFRISRAPPTSTQRDPALPLSASRLSD